MVITVNTLPAKHQRVSIVTGGREHSIVCIQPQSRAWQSRRHGCRDLVALCWSLQANCVSSTKRCNSLRDETKAANNFLLEIAPDSHTEPLTPYTVTR